MSNVESQVFTLKPLQFSSTAENRTLRTLYYEAGVFNHSDTAILLILHLKRDVVCATVVIFICYV